MPQLLNIQELCQKEPLVNGFLFESEIFTNCHSKGSLTVTWIDVKNISYFQMLEILVDSLKSYAIQMYCMNLEVATHQ